MEMDLLSALVFLSVAEYTSGLVELQFLGRAPLLMQRYTRTTLPTLYQCLDLCVTYKLCKSFYYTNNNAIRRCVLNADDFRQISTWGANYGYTSMEKAHIPKRYGGMCSGHSCAINEMCMQSNTTYVCIEHDYSTVKCPEEWARFEDMCYTLTTDQLTFEEAKEYCANTGAELVTFDSWKEFTQNKGWIHFRLARTLGKLPSGNLWTGLTYSLPMPHWLPFNHPDTNESDLCVLMTYTSRGTSGSLRIGPLEARSCNEQNGVVCQHKAPEHWP
ncbi:uncharacterized protein [Argopecten irradians]|uniref:uncharacterized protein n=1 Tax=Argopecten irradians TaxID=31199 RepID=UPI003712E0C9